MNTIRTGDILQITRGFIVHQVNSVGVMNAGLAEKIREKYPVVFRDYKTAYARGRLLLGEVVLSHVRPHLWVASIVGQENYGRGGRHTNYDALRRGLILVALQAHLNQETLYIPFGIGCGLGGGDWQVVVDIIASSTPEAVIIKKEE